MKKEQFIEFFEELQERDGVKLQLKINDNRQTMVSVRWDPDQTKVSIHQMFLKAPENVMEALACYIKREHKVIAPEVKAFIETNRTKFNYAHLVDTARLSTAGKIYDLKYIYAKMNRNYFKNSLDLSITWFGDPLTKSRSRLSLGLYYDSLKLVKIHRLLDNRHVPRHVVEFVVFHEMLHAVCPAYIDEKGCHRVHGKEFKRQEESFPYYNEAQEWIRKHQADFFLTQGGHGRSQQMGKY